MHKRKERRSSIGDVVKDLEHAYEDAQVEVLHLSEQVREANTEVLWLKEQMKAQAEEMGGARAGTPPGVVKGSRDA